MIAASSRIKIDNWINEAPEFRKVECQPLASDAWESRAVEDGRTVFEEVDVDTDEPILRRLATWCEEHTKSSAKPPVKAGGARHGVADPGSSAPHGHHRHGADAREHGVGESVAKGRSFRRHSRVTWGG